MRTTSSGIATTTFSIAVNRNFTNQNGEREADFINIVTWRKQAENVAKYLAKDKGITALMGYDTDEMLDFLQKPIAEIKQNIGGKWAELEDIQLEPLIYSLSKKVKK